MSDRVWRPYLFRPCLQRLEDRTLLSGPDRWTDPYPVPGWTGHGTEDAAVAVGDLDGNGRPEFLVVHADAPDGANTLYMRVGRDVDANGVAAAWSGPTPLPLPVGHHDQGVGAALYDFDRNGQLDLAVMHVDHGDKNHGFLSIGWNLDGEGRPTGDLRTHQLWTGPTRLPSEWGTATQGAGLAVAARADATLMYAYFVDNATGDNVGYETVWVGPNSGGGYWSAPRRLTGWIGHETQGADVAVADLDQDGGLDRLTAWVDNPSGPNRGYLRVNDGDATPVPGLFGDSTQGVGVALVDLNDNGRPEVVLLHVDNPAGENTAYIRVGFDLGPPPAPLPAVTIGDVTVTEGDAGTTEAVFPVRLLTPSSQTVSVRVATAASSARPGYDYVETAGTVTFAPGQTEATFTVLVVGDTTYEPPVTLGGVTTHEQFRVRLSAADGARILDDEATGTIRDDDSAPPTITVKTTPVTEGDAGETSLVYTVTLSAKSQSIVSVLFNTQPGTATLADYISVSGVLTFMPGETKLEIRVPVINDLIPEGDETVLLNLRTPFNAIIPAGGEQTTGTIVDNDSSRPSPPAASAAELAATVWIGSQGGPGGRAYLAFGSHAWTGGRGITVATWDPAGQTFAGVTTFDGWGDKGQLRALVSYLDAVPQGSLLALAVGDEAGLKNWATDRPWFFPEVEPALLAIEKLGGGGLRYAPYRAAYALLTIKGGPVLAEQASAREGRLSVSAPLPSAPVPVAARAAAAGQGGIAVTSEGGPVGGIKVVLDGAITYAHAGGAGGGRGITVAVIAPGAGAFETRTYDTWSDKHEFENLTAQLAGLSVGTLLVVAAGDEAGFIDWATGKPWDQPEVEAAYRALEALGSDHVREVAYRGGWALVVEKGVRVFTEKVSAPETPLVLYVPAAAYAPPALIISPGAVDAALTVGLGAGPVALPAGGSTAVARPDADKAVSADTLLISVPAGASGIDASVVTAGGSDRRFGGQVDATPAARHGAAARARRLRRRHRGPNGRGHVPAARHRHR